MRLLGALLGLVLLPASPPSPCLPSAMSSPDPFQLVARPAVLSPGDMLALPRPGPPQPNPAGDLALVAVTEWSFDDRE